MTCAWPRNWPTVSSSCMRRGRFLWDRCRRWKELRMKSCNSSWSLTNWLSRAKTPAGSERCIRDRAASVSCPLLQHLSQLSPRARRYSCVAQDILQHVDRKISGNLCEPSRRREFIGQQCRLHFVAMRPLRVTAGDRRQELRPDFGLERFHKPRLGHLRIGQCGLEDTLFLVEKQSRRYPSGTPLGQGESLTG